MALLGFYWGSLGEVCRRKQEKREKDGREHHERKQHEETISSSEGSQRKTQGFEARPVRSDAGD